MGTFGCNITKLDKQTFTSVFDSDLVPFAPYLSKKLGKLLHDFFFLFSWSTERKKEIF